MFNPLYFVTIVNKITVCNLSIVEIQINIILPSE